MTDDSPCPGHPVQVATAGVKTWFGEALTDPALHLCGLWLLHHQWLLLGMDPPVPREEPGIDGVRTLYICN
jgi:hypothetical protein